MVVCPQVDKKKGSLKIICPLLKFVSIGFLVFMSLLLEQHLLDLPQADLGRWKALCVCACKYCAFLSILPYLTCQEINTGIKEIQNVWFLFQELE